MTCRFGAHSKPMKSQTEIAAERAANAAALSGQGASLMAASNAATATGTPFGATSESTRQTDEGNTLSLFILNRSKLNDPTTYLGSAPLPDDDIEGE